jgi:integrase
MVHQITTYISNTYHSHLLFVAVFAAVSSKILNIEMPEETKPKFKKPRLVDHNGDVSKRWYIVYYATSKTSGELVRQRFTLKLNQIQDKEKRYKLAESYIKQITEYLEKGLQVVESEAKQKREDQGFTLPEAIQYAFDKKSKDLSKNWQQTYRWVISQVNLFFEKKPKIEIQKLKTLHVVEIMEWMEKKNGFGPKTFNEYLGIIYSSLEYLVSLDLLEKNVAKKVARKRVPKGEKNIPFNIEAIAKLKAEAEKDKNLQWCIFIDFCLFTLARPRKELHFLKVGEIREKSIFIPKERGKTGGRSVPIIPPLEKLIQKHGLRNYPADFYVFGKEGKPSEKPFTTTHFYDFLSKYLKICKLTGEGHTLYALKHTGAIMCYKAGVPINIIQILCGHSSPSQTAQYLTNMGLINPTDQFLGNWPEY